MDDMDNLMKKIFTVWALLIVIALFVLLTKDKDKQLEGPENVSGFAEITVTMADGREVPCIIKGQVNRGYLSCDWDNVRIQ